MRSRTVARRSLEVAAVVGFLALGASSAQANEAIKLHLHGVVSSTRTDGMSLGTGLGQDEPDILADKNVGFAGDATLYGGGFGGTFVVDQVRIGLGLSVFGLDGARVTHDFVPGGFGTENGGIWGESLDFSLGYEFMLGPLFPYIDLRSGMDIIAVNIRVRSGQYGLLGTTNYSKILFGLGPRVGLFVPLGDLLFVDASGYAGILGVAKFGGTFSFGVWGS